MPDDDLKLPPLFFAVERNDVAEVRRLLEEGADPNDGESVYHGAQWNRRECLELLLAHGADLSSRHPQWKNTPLFFLAGHFSDDEGQADWVKGMQWLLEHGADPNVASYDAAETPLHKLARWSPSLAPITLLLAHGGNPNQPRADGRTPYATAVRWGNAAVADLLQRHGGSPDEVTSMDLFVGACRLGDEPEARRLAADNPGWHDALMPEDRGAVGSAVWADRPGAIQLMASLGFDLAWEAEDGGTALHWAAWLGKTDLVRLLINLGAPINYRDSTYGSSPIAWACHGSTNFHGGGDYSAAVELLIDAGAEWKAAINKHDEPPTEFASPAVAAVLARRGFEPPEPT